MSEHSYANYSRWKSWSEESFLQFSAHEANYLSADFSGITLHDSKFLEIGFGNGALMSWARSKGAHIYGIELLEASIERARARGIPLLSPKLEDNLPEFSEYFDVVAAYDVLEHLSLPEVITALDIIAKLLKPGGTLILRFPNGQSPFGRFLQHADLTHRCTLSLAILDQLTMCGPLTISSVKLKKPKPIGSLAHRAGSIIKSAMRTATEWYLKKIFDLNCELGTNVVVRLIKSPIQAPHESIERS
jgi:2-polyprenyl-3-methyl-5-hydroxy-6-metoxy-1,4-benzoquinol methylase